MGTIVSTNFHVGQRQKQWAKQARIKLLAELGDCCKGCGSVKKLEFDYIIPQGDEHHKMDSSARLSFYRAQHRANNLQLLCKRPCHSRKSAREKRNQVVCTSFSRSSTTESPEAITVTASSVSNDLSEPNETLTMHSLEALRVINDRSSLAEVKFLLWDESINAPVGCDGKPVISRTFTSPCQCQKFLMAHNIKLVSRKGICPLVP